VMGQFLGLILLGLMISSGLVSLSTSIDDYSEKIMIINGFHEVCGDHWYSGCEWVKKEDEYWFCKPHIIFSAIGLHPRLKLLPNNPLNISTSFSYNRWLGRN